MRDLDPRRVSARLAELRRIYVAERVDVGTARLERERPMRRESFDFAVARRLRELRALCELARHLHRPRPAGLR